MTASCCSLHLQRCTREDEAGGVASSGLQTVLQCRASVTVGCLSVVSITSPGTSGTTAPCSQHRWEQLRGCALFSTVGRSSVVEHRAVVRRVLVVSLPAMVILRHEEDSKLSQQSFSLCDRVPQSQLVQVTTSRQAGRLG